ncbi:hypothetical protein UCRPC4_g02237 [Phaeomoniella chlamydospora]|uniref:Chromatin spt2 n=1 Tax=Phaeomoniella chlamydospora TaxID=158046 RepID=A0A0G2ES09_PHACM|nr:hypothetical protein UCRPC4_g02237 [Phaeomoniella chlamydospora]
MSLLNSVLGSIGSGKSTPLPKGPGRAAIDTPPATKQTPGATQQTDHQSPAPKSSSQYLGSSSAQPIPAKRKFPENNIQRSSSGASDKQGSSADGSKLMKTEPSSSASKQNTVTGQQNLIKTKKEPPKGSYLALLEQAKALQAEKASQGQRIGMIKHAASSKEKLSKVERRRRDQELRAQSQGKGRRVGENGAIQKLGRPTNGKDRNVEDRGYKGTARPPAGHNPQGRSAARSRDREEPTYKGTAGMKKPPTGGKPTGKNGREDQYFDEEDDGWLVDDDGDEGHSTGPKYRYAEDYDDDSDMEAGYSDVEDEEVEAEKQAKRDDARERALEERLKREKEARKKAFARPY